MVALINKYLPDIVSNKSFETQVGKFRIRYENLKAKLLIEGDAKVEIHSIYEWIVSAEAGDGKSISFLRFLNDICKNVELKIAVSLRPKLRSIITNILTSFDTNVELDNNPTYLNYLGELLIINRLLNIPNKIRLTGIEVKMPNGKMADIQLMDMSDGAKILFDVLSINSFDPTIPKSDEDALAFFNGRFNMKMQAKTNRLDETDFGTSLIIDGEAVKFGIAPIIWNEVEDLVRWNDIFTKLENSYLNVLPMMILCAQHENGGYAFTFSKVSEALNHWRYTSASSATRLPRNT